MGDAVKIDCETYFYSNVGSKVVALEVHPFYPWLLTAHKNSNIVIWNYELKKTLYDINLQSLDDDDIATLNPTLGTLASSSGGVSGTGGNNSSGGPGQSVFQSSSISGGGGASQSASGMGGGTSSTTSGVGNSSSGTSSTSGVSSGGGGGGAQSDAATKQALEKKFGQIKTIRFYDKYSKQLKAITESNYKTTLFATSPTGSSSDGRKSSYSSYDFSRKTAPNSSSSIIKKSGSGMECKDVTAMNFEPTLVIILTEYRVLFFDYESLSFSEIRLSSFDQKPPLSVDFFSDHPFLCFGGSDGQIRVWDFEKKEFYTPPERSGGNSKTTKGWLSGAHKSGVTKLFCVPPPTTTTLSSPSTKGGNASPPRQLLSGGSDGTLCMWDLASEKDHNFTLQKKMFTSDVIGFTFNFVDGTLLIAESKPTQDRLIYGWNVSLNHEVYKINLKKKMNSKQAIGIITTLDALPHPRFGPSTILLTFKADTKLYVLSGETGIREIVDIAMKIPPCLISSSLKKQIKLYGAVVHPLQPHLVFCNTNVGLISYQIERTWLPTVAYNITLDNKFALYTIVNDKITTQELDYERGNLVKRSAVKGLENATTGIKLMGSPSGKYLAVFWEESHFFQILDIASGCKTIDQAAAYSFVWAGGQDRYAYLESTLFSEQSGKSKEESKRRGTKSGGIMGVLGKGSGSGSSSGIGKKTLTNQAVQHGRLRIKDIEHDQMKEVVEDLSWFLQALNARVIRLFGGALLGILSDPSTPPTNSSTLSTSSSTSPSNASASSESSTARRRPTSVREQSATSGGSSSPITNSSKDVGNSALNSNITGGNSNISNNSSLQGISETQLPFLQFYSWNTQDAVGSQLAPPLEIVSSDGDVRCVGLIYPTHVCIFSISPTIKLISKINKPVLSAFWLRSTFFYATPTTIEAVFPHAEDEEGMIVASGIYLNNQPLRPIGSLAFVSAFRDRILVVDCMNVMHWIWLGDPLLQFYLLVGSRNISEAVTRARKIENKKQNDKLARYLVQMGYPREATQLPSISTQLKLRIAIKFNIFDVATEILCSLLDKAVPLIGYNHSPSRSSSSSSSVYKLVGRLPLEKLKQWNTTSVTSSALSPHTPHAAHTPHTQTSPHSLNPISTPAFSASTEQILVKTHPTSQKFVSDINMSTSTKPTTSSEDVPLEWTIKRLVECAKGVGNALLVASQHHYADLLFQKLVLFDSEAYKQLASIYESRGEKEKIKRLYDDLCSRGHYDSAKYVALFLEDSLLSSSLQHSVHSSESIAFFTSDSGGTKEDVNSTRRWNEMFQQQKYDRYSSESQITFKSFAPSMPPIST